MSVTPAHHRYYVACSVDTHLRYLGPAAATRAHAARHQQRWQIMTEADNIKLYRMAVRTGQLGSCLHYRVN
jgi:hypothetical protein